jgi:CelD/BcsL family acetyltransferase involved in cellulose biosynthesis
VGLTQIDPRLHARPTTTAAIRTDNYIRTSHVEVTGTFDAYWEQRGKNLRQNMRKQRNKLQADGIATRLDCVTDAAGVPQALVDYGRLETTGWKSDAGTAIHPDNAQGRFYRAVLERFCAAGRGRIYRYWFNDTVVAMDLCIDNGPLVVVLKTAYDEAQRQVSPSVLMRQEQFEAWWAEGRYRRIEFYGKTLEWHTRWTALERELYHVTAYRWGWLQQAAKWLVRRDGAPPAVAPDAQAAKSAA